MRKYILGLVLIFAAGYSNSAALNTRTLTPTVTTSLTFTDTFTHTPTNTPTDSLTPTKTKTPTFTKTFTNTRTPIPYGAGGASEDTLRKVATELARGNSAYSPTPTPTSLTTTPTPVFTTTMTGTLGVLLTTTPSPTPTLTSTALTHTPSMTKTYTPEGKVVVVVFASKTNTPIPWCPSASMTSTLTPNSTYIVASCTPTLTPLAQDVNVRSMPSPYTTAIHNVEVRNAVANAQAVRTALPLSVIEAIVYQPTATLTPTWVPSMTPSPTPQGTRYYSWSYTFPTVTTSLLAPVTLNRIYRNHAIFPVVSGSTGVTFHFYGLGINAPIGSLGVGSPIISNCLVNSFSSVVDRPCSIVGILPFGTITPAPTVTIYVTDWDNPQ